MGVSVVASQVAYVKKNLQVIKMKHNHLHPNLEDVTAVYHSLAQKEIYHFFP